MGQLAEYLAEEYCSQRFKSKRNWEFRNIVESARRCSDLEKHFYINKGYVHITNGIRSDAFNRLFVWSGKTYWPLIFYTEVNETFEKQKEILDIAVKLALRESKTGVILWPVTTIKMFSTEE